MNEKLKKDVLKLPAKQRLALVGEVWDSLDDEEIPTSPALLKVLRERIAYFKAHPEETMTLAELKKKIERLRKHYDRNRRKTA